VLFKPGKLNPDESDLMALHHCVSLDVLQAARVNLQVLEIVGQSRDFTCAAAKGPRRALGTLHQGARILSVADAYDSLRTEQVYRKAKPHDEAMKILVENTGTQFDGNVINALLRWAAASGLAKLIEYETPCQPGDVGIVFGDPQEARDADMLSRIFSHLYLLENLYDGFYVVDADLRFLVWNGGLPLRQAIESQHAAARNVKILNAAGNWIDVELQSIPLVDRSGKLRGVAEILRDTSRKELAPFESRELRISADRDALTGVANRDELRTQLGHLLEGAAREDWKVPLSVIVVEVDHFRQINDRFGRPAGDLVLIRERLSAGTPAGHSPFSVRRRSANRPQNAPNAFASCSAGCGWPSLKTGPSRGRLA
jgi:hypothetical protein